MNWASFKNGCIVQGRVIWALMLREIHTINGDSKLGYLWVLIQTAFSIGVFWGIRTIMGATPPAGMSMLMFLSSGFCLWGVFNSGITKSLSAISGNKALLTFPQVTALDVVVSRIIVLTSTQLISFFVFFIIGFFLNADFSRLNIGLCLFVWIVAPLLTLGFGLTLTSFATYFPVINQVVPMGMRILMFMSGVFYSSNAFPWHFREIALLNPFLQLIELFREGIDSSYHITGLSYFYVLSLTLISLVIGGFLESFTRTRRLSE